MHEEIKSWERRVDDMCADLPPRPVPTETPSEYPSFELELELGHRMLSGEITAEEAYELLGE